MPALPVIEAVLMTDTIKVAGKRVPYPKPSSSGMTAVMRGNSGRDTGLETAIRKLVHARGYRFRKNFLIQVGAVRVRPDIVFTRRRLAVFLDGCFWHGCPLHGNRPRVNQAYWEAKLAKNRDRDTAVNMALVDAGWTVLRLWEHLTPQQAADQITAQVDAQCGFVATLA